jgi:hypothetical protein
MGINWRLSTLLACWQPAQWEKLNRRDHSEVGRTFGEFLDLDKINFVPNNCGFSPTGADLRLRRHLLMAYNNAGQVVQTELIKVQPEQ